MTHPSHPPTDPLTRVFAYRAIDLRDRFPQPLESFREALECLQSDRSYMAAMSGEIIAYLRGGYSLTIPDEFFIRRSGEIDATLVPPEENDAVCAKVQAWLRETLTRPDVDTTKGVPLEQRPYSLEQLLAHGQLQSPQSLNINNPQSLSEEERGALAYLNATSLWEAAQHVLGSREKAYDWIKSPHEKLEGKTPEQVFPEDKAQVLSLLIRIKYTIYA
ncbi:MbcA/ParS/Xre antitoxin family protein [Halomonas halodenitrificans]|uniref:MbcA/ParS/Xre antitoxin family protein n=1 Tax=Halomonas halodenitrificans TaxID=28252 RepID=UPI000684B488|nr:MbcA/ParS/Xre antitoxin family protein [Halomonas halodenitrificans]